MVFFSGLSPLRSISYEVPWVEPPQRCWGAVHSASEGGLHLSTSSAEIINMVRVIVVVMRKPSTFCVYIMKLCEAISGCFCLGDFSIYSTSQPRSCPMNFQGQIKAVGRVGGKGVIGSIGICDP